MLTKHDFMLHVHPMCAKAMLSYAERYYTDNVHAQADSTSIGTAIAKGHHWASYKQRVLADAMCGRVLHMNQTDALDEDVLMAAGEGIAAATWCRGRTRTGGRSSQSSVRSGGTSSGAVATGGSTGGFTTSTSPLPSPLRARQPIHHDSAEHSTPGHRSRVTPLVPLPPPSPPLKASSIGGGKDPSTGPGPGTGPGTEGTGTCFPRLGPNGRFRNKPAQPPSAIPRSRVVHTRGVGHAMPRPKLPSHMACMKRYSLRGAGMIINNQSGELATYQQHEVGEGPDQ